MRRVIASVLWTAALVWMPLTAYAFGISPAIVDMEGSRGRVVAGTFHLINTSAAAQTFYLETLNFSPGEGDGVPTFIPYESDHSGLPEWIRFANDTISLAPYAAATIAFDVAIPADIASQEYRAAIVVSDRPYDVRAEVEPLLSAKAAVLVFLTVEGETREQAALLDVSGAATVQAESDLAVSVRVQNQGNVSVIPQGTLTIRDAFGRVLGETSVNAEQARVLPGTTRELHVQVGTSYDEGLQSFLDRAGNEMRNFAIGPVTATLDLKTATGAPIGSETISYWVFPWHLVTVIGIVVLGVVLLGLLVKRRYSKQ